MNDSPGRGRSAGLARSVAVYTLLRLALFALAFVVLFVLAGQSGPLSIVLALVASSLGSLVLLRTQRDAVSTALLERSRSRTEARDRRRTALDE